MINIIHRRQTEMLGKVIGTVNQFFNKKGINGSWIETLIRGLNI